MKGVIFAAGLGTRLYPYTKDKPKALVEVQGVTMLEHTLLTMYRAGIREVVINVHAFADLVETWIRTWSTAYPAMVIHITDERPLLLETGGGLKQMSGWLQDAPFLVHNVDVLSTINLKQLIQADAGYHATAQSECRHIATLAVRKTIGERNFLFSEAGLLCGWENRKTGEKRLSRPWEKNLQAFGFTGIHVISPSLFPLMTETGVFSITDVYLRLAARHAIRLCDVSEAAWFDIGSPEQLTKAESSGLV